MPLHSKQGITTVISRLGLMPDSIIQKIYRAAGAIGILKGVSRKKGNEACEKNDQILYLHTNWR